MSKLEVKIDVTDWRDDAMREEFIIADRESIVDAISSGKSTAATAKALVVNQELGNCVRMFENKILFLTGAMAEVGAIVRAEKVETEDGKFIPAFVGKIVERDQEDLGAEERSYANSLSSAGHERAESYLRQVVPGHIFPRLQIIHANGGDVKKAALELKLKIDEFVNAL